MIEKIMKAIKSGNKKKGGNITVGAVVGFLLSCTAVMGADNYLWIKEDGGAIEFNTAITTDANGTGGNWNAANPYEENELNGNTYINNTVLSSSANNGNNDVSYGLRLSGDLSGFNFVNNSLIIGTNTGDNRCYGIYNDGTIGSITNTGLITGASTGSIVISGIDNTYNTIKNITNIGVIIRGNSNYKGYGIDSWGTMGNVKNVGLIAGVGGREARGIVVGGGQRAESIYNDGLIIATSELDYMAFGICIIGHIDNSIVNNGSIIGIGMENGRGINLDNGIPILTNTGLIIGKDRGNSRFITAGIYTGYDAKKGIVNSGLIIGTTTGSSPSYGIANGSLSNIVEKITNTGVIFGKTNAVWSDAGKRINSLGNYGILATEGNSIKDGTITTENNYGLYITDTDGKVSFDDTKQSNSPVEIVVGYDDSKNEIKREMTIKNAPISGGLASGVGTSTDSLEFTGAVNEFNDSILNGKDKTLKVSGNREISGSIINAYGTAVVFDGTGSQLTLSGTVVNGGSDGTNNGITGSSNGDTLILEGAEIQYKDIGNKFQQTVINGNIDMGNGNNKITLKKGSGVNGKVATGDGADIIAIENEAVVNGEVIMGDGEDNLSLKSGAIVNGNIDMGNDDDTFTIEKGSIINGTLNGGTGNDTLNFNPETTRALGNSEINILHNISDFENMNINTNVTLFEKTIEDNGTPTDLAITGAENITIGANGVLTLRLDITNIDKTSGTDKIKGHALYGNNGTITSTGGKLLLALNGAGNESVISFGDTILDGSLVTAHETKVEGEINFATTSLLHKVKRIEGKTNEVIITSKADLPTDISYKKLNEIYHSILSVDELGNFNVDDDEKLSTFLSYLNDIYAGNPYSYSSELSRKSAGMFRDIVTENIFKPETNKWMIYGGLTHVDGGTKDTYYGKGYYTYDIGSSDMDADTKITGAYMLGEYGISDTLTSGVVIGGNKLKSDLSNGSKVDGSALYLGAYAKKYIGSLKVTAGAGFQYGDYDADRLAVNKVASDSAESVMKYSDNYNDITYDIYLNGRYSHQVGDNLFLEPYGTLSYTYVDQDGANEGNKILAIETDSKSFDYTVAKVGVDLKKVISHEKGKSTFSAGVSYTKILDGADEEHITGRFKGGSDFDILVAHKNEHSIGLNAKYALELENGVLFDVKGTYSVERDSHNNSGKNKTKGEWIVGAGIGYKF